jgi:hypothetical protein
MHLENINREEVSLQNRLPYEAPKVKFMDEQEIFAALQVSVNATTWWGGM